VFRRPICQHLKTRKCTAPVVSSPTETIAPPSKKLKRAKLAIDNSDSDGWPHDDSLSAQLSPPPSTPPHDDDAADLVTNLSLDVPLPPQTCLMTDALAPSWMGDTGFQDEHLDAWRRAETQFDLKHVPPNTPKHQEPLSANNDFDKRSG